MYTLQCSFRAEDIVFLFLGAMFALSENFSIDFPLTSKVLSWKHSWLSYSISIHRIYHALTRDKICKIESFLTLMTNKFIAFSPILFNKSTFKSIQL